MSLAKRLMEREQELGFSLADGGRSVCPECIADPALRQFVDGHAYIDECSFCGGPGPQGMHLESLFEYMSGCVRAEYDDPLHEVAWDGGWVSAAVFGTDDLLIELDEPLGNPTLREAFVLAFDREWCQANPHGLPYDRMLSHSWERFADYVRTRGRYLFLRTGRRREDRDPDTFEPARLLDEVHKAIHNADVIRCLPEGSRLVRARAHPARERPTSSAELGSPPTRATNPNRMSPAGISMFYAAEDQDTALAELRPRAGDWATVGTWTTTRDLHYLDLAELPPVPSLFHEFRRTLRPWLKFLHEFAWEVARPVEAEAGPVEYVPTQIFTEFLRDEVLALDGAPIEGIRYRSAIRADGMCWALFVDALECHDGAGGLLRLDPAHVDRFQPWWRPSPPEQA